MSTRGTTTQNAPDMLRALQASIDAVDEGPRESADDRLPENPDAVGALAEVLASNMAMRTQLDKMRTHARLAKDALGKGDRLSGELHASILLEMAAAVTP